MAVAGAFLLALTVAPLLGAGDGTAVAGVVVASLLLAAMAHLGAHVAVALPRGSTAPPSRRALDLGARRGRTTDPIHHPRRPRAPGKG